MALVDDARGIGWLPGLARAVLVKVLAQGGDELLLDGWIDKDMVDADADLHTISNMLLVTFWMVTPYLSGIHEFRICNSLGGQIDIC